MDREFVDTYLQELEHLREMGNEFAQAYPKIAQRLMLDSVPCPDPYVERLLEGFAFLAARVRHKLEAEFPRFTQALLNTVYPHYLMPTPSMTMVQFQPDHSEDALAQGWRIPRGSMLRSIPGKDERTPCQFTTAHDVDLWPLDITEVRYHARDVIQLREDAFQAQDAGSAFETKSMLRIHVSVTAGLTADALDLDTLVLHLPDTGGEVPMQLYERLMAQCSGVVMEWLADGKRHQAFLPPTRVQPLGFAPEEALLPNDKRVFDGYRLLREYFAFPQRFMFVKLTGLAAAMKLCPSREFDLCFTLRTVDPALERDVGRRNFALHCTPAINLFAKRADRIHLSDRFTEFHVVPDRTRPIDFEVLRVTEVKGYGADLAEIQTFRPFYAATQSRSDQEAGPAYYTVHRVRRTPSQRERQGIRRSAYTGSEVYLALVDQRAAPYRSDLRELSVATLCSNRDLPTQMVVGAGSTDFSLDVNAPINAIRCLGRPTSPVASHVEHPADWRAISHLSLNYLSLVNGDDEQTGGAAALREILHLYVDPDDADSLAQIEGLVSVDSHVVTRRLDQKGPLAFARGVEVTLTFNEDAFRGHGVFLLGSVLEHFFRHYVSINSFAETVLSSVSRGEIMRWSPRRSMRPIL